MDTPTFLNLAALPVLQRSETLLLQVNTGQHYHAPGFLHEFGDRTDYVGNPDLSLERNFVQEASLVFKPGPALGMDHFQAGVSIFQNNINNRIDWVDDGSGALVAENVGGAVVYGVELSALMNVRDAVEVGVSYCWQETDNDSDSTAYRGDELPGAPRNTAGVTATLYRSFGRLYYKGHYQDTRYLDALNEIEEKPRLEHDLGVACLRGRWSVGIEGKNIGNDRSREALGYPLPGTTYMAFVEVKE